MTDKPQQTNASSWSRLPINQSKSPLFFIAELEAKISRKGEKKINITKIKKKGKRTKTKKKVNEP